MKPDFKSHIGSYFLPEFRHNLPGNTDNISLCSSPGNDIANLSTNTPLQAPDLIYFILIEFFNLKILDHQWTFIFIDTFSGKYLGVYDNAGDPGGDTQWRIFHILGFFAENSTKQFFFRWKDGFTLRGNLTDQGVTRLDLSPYPDNAWIVEIAQRFFTHIWNITGNLFFSEFSIPSHCLKHLDMYGGEGIFLKQSLVDQYWVFKIKPTPWHKGNGHVFAKGQFALLTGRPISQNGPFCDPGSGEHQRCLGEAGILVGFFILTKTIDCNSGIVAIDTRPIVTNDNTVGIRLFNDTFIGTHETGSWVLRHIPFHAGSHQRSSSYHERDSLSLHVGTHQSSVGVIVFQKGYQWSRNTHQLIRGDIHIGHLISRGGKYLAIFTNDEVVGNNPFVEIRFDECGGYNMLLLLQGTQILHFIENDAIINFSVWRLDKSIRIDSSIGCQRNDQTNIRTLRSLNWTDTAIMGGMDVTDFKAGPFAWKTTRSERTKTSLMGHLGKRIRLVHKLR